MRGGEGKEQKEGMGRKRKKRETVKGEKLKEERREHPDHGIR